MLLYCTSAHYTIIWVLTKSDYCSIFFEVGGGEGGRGSCLSLVVNEDSLHCLLDGAHGVLHHGHVDVQPVT